MKALLLSLLLCVPVFAGTVFSAPGSDISVASSGGGGGVTVGDLTSDSTALTVTDGGGAVVGAGTVLSIADAVANGSTKGVAGFTAADFVDALGIISLDYDNGQSANSSRPGFLIASDWIAFNAKESPLTFTSPLSRSTNTISIANAAADGSTKGSAAFNSNDFDASSGVVSLDYTNAQMASGSVAGFVSATTQSFAGAKSFTFGTMTSSGTNPAQTGVIRLANAESIVWRDSEDTRALSLTLDSGEQWVFSGTLAGSDSVVSVKNSDNTNGASNSLFRVNTGGASGGDPYYDMVIDGVTSWSMGIDNSDSDSLVFCRGAPGTNCVIKATTANAVQFPQLTATTVPYLDSNKALVSSAVTPTALGYVENLSSDAQTQITARALAANAALTGVVTFDDGSVSAPSIMNAGDTNTGFYWPSGDGDQVGITTAGTGNILFGSSGLATLLKSGPSGYTYQINYGAGATGVQGLRINAAGSGLSAYFEHTSNSKGHAIYTNDSAGASNKWRFTRVDGNYYDGWFGEMGQVYWGGSQTGQKGVTVTIQGQPDKSNIGGTTTVNASTTVTGSSTSFLEHVGIGDRISVSSSASTYATVTAIASNTSLTVDAALGDGTSQTINMKRAILRLDKAAGAAVYGLVNDAGKWTIGEASTTEIHALNTAVGTPASDALTLLNGPDGLAGNPAVYIPFVVNGTTRYIPAW